MPEDIPQIRTLALEYAMSTLICSMARAVRKHDAPHRYGTMPPFASPLPIPTMFCSAMPTLTNREGYFPMKSFIFAEESESLITTHTRVSCSAISSKALAYAFRQSNNWGLCDSLIPGITGLTMLPPRPVPFERSPVAPGSALHDATRAC